MRKTFQQPRESVKFIKNVELGIISNKSLWRISVLTYHGRFNSLEDENLIRHSLVRIGLVSLWKIEAAVVEILDFLENLRLQEGSSKVQVWNKIQLINTFGGCFYSHRKKDILHFLFLNAKTLSYDILHCTDTDTAADILTFFQKWTPKFF